MLQTLAMFRLNRSSLRLEPTRPSGGFQEKEIMSKYKVEVVASYWQTIEVEAQSREEAQVTALDLFDIDQARQGEGEIYDTELIGETA